VTHRPAGPARTPFRSSPLLGAIAAQPLAAGLIAFGQQAGVQVSVSGQLLRDKQAGAVQGDLTGGS